MRSSILSFAFRNLKERLVVVGKLVRADSFLVKPGKDLLHRTRFVNLHESGPPGGTVRLPGGSLGFLLFFLGEFSLEEIEIRILLGEAP